jgi:hypothetical protein
MDGRIFDALSQQIASASTRRRALGALVAASIGSAALGSEADAKGKGKKKKRKRKCKKAAGKPCTSNKKCCPGKTNNICAVRSGAGNSDTTCCGGANAKCGGFNEDLDALPPFCCQDFACNSLVPGVPGTCQPVPPI